MQLLKINSLVLFLFATLFCCFYGIGSITRDQENILFTFYAISFFSYLYLLYLILIKKVSVKLINLLFFAIIIRLGLFFSFPNLSDDFFRFSWDGNVVLDGSNPYQYKPNEFHFSNDKIEKFAQNNLLSSTETSFCNGMNSNDYYSVYPPVTQCVFMTCSFLAENNLFENVLYLRIFLLCFEIIGWFFMIKILTHYNINRLKSMIYVLNPLVILELTGNLHFEGITLTFLIISFYLLIVNKYVLSAIVYSVAICLKLMPILFLPLILYKIGVKKAVVFLTTIFLFCLLFFAPFMEINLLNTFFESIQLYFNTFEFNASVYYVFRWVGTFFTGYNQIGIIGSITPFITIIAMLLIIINSRSTMNVSSLMKKMSWILLIYFSVASIVHPWYVVYFIGFSVFTGYVFPIAWAGVVFLSYMAYKNIGVVEEEPILIFIEYFIVLLAVIYDLNQKKIISFFLKDDGLKLPA